MENKLQNVLVCHKRSKLELVDHLVNMSKSDTVLQNCHQLSSVGGLTDVLYNDMHCTCCYLFDTVWHEIFAGFNFCDFCHNPQKKIPAKICYANIYSTTEIIKIII